MVLAPFAAPTAASGIAGVLYSLKALLDPDVPNNQGLIEIVDINAPLGTLINSKFPAAVAARANTAQRIVDVVIGALAPAIPEAAVGAANGANTTAVFFGHDPRHDRHYVYLETLGGGFGGRFTKRSPWPENVIVWPTGRTTRRNPSPPRYLPAPPESGTKP